MRELIGIYTIWLRDVKKFFRDVPRMIGSVAQPALFLFVLGLGLSSSFKIFGGTQGGGFLDFMFPGIIGMTTLFTAFFSGISIIWDREFGFLREVLVSPVSRTSIVIGKILGGSTVAVFQAIIILIFAPILKIHLTVIWVAKLTGVMFLTAIAISSFGIALASRMKSVQGFQAITNFLLMPMFFLSGALFPLEGAPQWMSFLAKLNPLSYGVDAMRFSILGDKRVQLFPMYLDVIVLIGAALAIGIVSVILFNIED